MLPGCQQYFKHKVKPDNNIRSKRYCLSFRRMLPPVDPNIVPAVFTITTPVKNLVKKFEDGNFSSDNIVAPPETSNDDVFKTPPSSPTSPMRKKTTVLFGTSITWDIQKRMGKLAAGRKFINVSNRGAKIKDIIIHLQDFHDTSAVAGDVEKIIFSLGTNDIKFSRRGVNHLKRYLVDLIDKAKSLFPGAIILFQCCLPIRDLYWYTVDNVLDFNKMLKSLCFNFNCVYVDCFRLFLSADEKDHNTGLFYDWLHLNWNGKGILCNFLYYVINQNSYNLVLDRIM